MALLVSWRQALHAIKFLYLFIFSTHSFTSFSSITDKQEWTEWKTFIAWETGSEFVRWRDEESVTGRRREKWDPTYANRKSEIESEVRRAIGRIFMLWSVSVDRGWVEQTCISCVPMVSFHGNAISHPSTCTVFLSALLYVPSRQLEAQMNCMIK